MAIFQYKALNQKGKELKGKLDAPNKKQAIQQLKSQQYYILSLQPLQSTREKITSGKQKNTKVSDKQITSFTRQLAIMLDTGISYDKALEILIQETKSPGFQNILSQIRTHILSGITLSKSLEQYPSVFTPMYTSIIRAGEEGGNLPEVMLRQAQYQEEENVMKSKVQTAMIYPVIMAVLGTGIMIFMITFILPRITPVFEHFGVALPLPTRIVIFISHLITENSWLLLGILLVLTLSLQKFGQTEQGYLFKHRLILKIPVLKEFLQRLYTLRFVLALGSLLKSGIDMEKSLQMASLVTGNKAWEKAMESLFKDISQKGFSLSTGLKKTQLFHDSIIQMIRVGEESGQLDSLLTKMSASLEVEVKQMLEKAVAFLEPGIIIATSIGVGFIVLAVLLPMFDMNQLF